MGCSDRSWTVREPRASSVRTDGGTVDILAPDDASRPLVRGVIAVGANHTCAIAADRSLRCWGSNRAGQLGDGTTTDRPTPTVVPGLLNVRAVAAAQQQNTCALLADGSMYCWGDNAWGQIGDGTVGDRTIPGAAARPVPARVASLANIIEIALCAQTACALLADHTIRCWGRNNSGAVGDGTTVDRPTPVAVVGVTNAMAIAGGLNHFCAVLLDGAIRCWGANESGELGDGTTIDRAVPVPVSGIVAAQAVGCSESFSCALGIDGSVQCWGLNQSGQLGDGTLVRRTVPVPVPGVRAITVRVGLSSSWAVAENRSVVGWGNNRFGQLGDGTTSDHLIPTLSPRITPDLVELAGGAHSCVMRNDGHPWCWGFNENGELGTGTTSTTPVLEPVPVIWN